MMQSCGTPDLIRVGVIEDQPVIRGALMHLFSTSQGYAVTGAYGSMEAALEGLADDLPDILLIDLGLPGMSGMDGIRAIRSRWPSVLMLILTVHEENNFIFESLCAGADGYLLKSTKPAELLRCVREVVQGGSPMSPAIARKVITLFRNVRPVPEEANELTAHELRILKLLASGENYKTSAKLLGVSVNTISYHVRSIYSKLHVHSRGDAVAKALRRGLIT
jgi:DNA-binding NarL/FixJ family response regulator